MERNFEELLAAARERVDGARALLARPRACNADDCATLFREAQGYLEGLRERLPQAAPASRELRRQALALTGELHQAAVLIDEAARFGRRWLAGLRLMAPEYTAAGRVVPLPVQGQISLLG